MRAPLKGSDTRELRQREGSAVTAARPESSLDRKTRMAASMFDTSWAFISLVEQDRQWFKSSYGLDADGAPGDVSLFTQPADPGAILLVPDAAADPRFAAHPSVTGSPGFRFYVGVPLVSHAGVVMGTLCVADPTARPLPEPRRLEVLTDLAAIVVDELEMRARVLRDRARDSASIQLAAIVESSNDAIIGKSLNGTIMSWNPAAERLYGYSAEEALGQKVSMLVPPDHPDEVPGMLRRICRGEVAQNIETVRLHKDGHRVEVSLTISPVRGAKNEVIGASTIARDISSHKLLQEQLRQASDEAVRMGNLKSEFLATMSHEIRTPMNGVIGMAGLLLDTDLSAEQREYAETVRSSGESLLTVINDILDFSKIEAGKLELEVIDFDLRTVVEEVAELLAEPAHKQGLELATLVEGGVPAVVRGDPGRVRQVLLNLVSNAVKFTESGEVVVRVKLVEEKDDGVVVRLDVTDTGIGIPAEAQQRLFTSFSQAHNSTTRKYGGTGLGLAISKRLTEMMGGEISMESTPGQGSRFSFSVPLEKGELSSVVARPAAAADLQGLRVLVVDDNAVNRAILRRNLQGWEMAPDCADGATQALSILTAAANAGKPHQVAILDFDMPEVNGLELARRIRSEPELAGLRLILLTSHVNRGDARQATDAGIDAYLTKPIRHSSLYECVAAVMGMASTVEPTPLITRHSLSEAKRAGRGAILVVDDNAVNQRVALRMVENLGYRADVAGNGLEAVAAVRRIPYAAVLMDCQMPEMDGFEATATIRSLAGNAADVPILAMTAGVMSGDQERCLEVGMDDFVSKPVDFNALAATLERWALEPRSSSSERVPGAEEATEAVLVGDEPVLDSSIVADLKVFVVRSDGGLGELVQLFLTGAEADLARLRTAVVEGDAEAITSVAHRMKGSSGSLGARRLASVCADLEAQASSGRTEGAPALLERIHAELETVRPALLAHCGGS